MLLDRDIIAAQATAPGEGGIAIVRLSGEGCEGVLLRVFRPAHAGELKNRRLTYGHLLDGGRVIDEAMAVMMRAPHSYTREDVAEIHCHGSQALVSRVLSLLLREGARMARPGEFTCRAFLNGRIDLTQAEAVMRMIRAGSDRALRSAVRQLEGGVSAFVREAREEITALLASLCAAVDFPDEVDEQETAEDVRERCLSLAARLRDACDPRAGRMEDEGLRVVLCGRPNAGKSSLLNALLGGERAIVTDIPGTTRDTLSESIQIDGLRVVLTDTAGLRETGDAVERIGVARAQKAIAEADVRVLVLDASVPLCGENDVLPDGFAPELIVLNKSDLPARMGEGELAARYPGVPQVMVCCVTGEGLDRLKRQLVAFAPVEDGESSALTQARHAQVALRACASLGDAAAALADGMPLDIAAVDLSAALDALGEITGETLREGVLDEIFSRFCVGK